MVMTPLAGVALFGAMLVGVYVGLGYGTVSDWFFRVYYSIGLLLVVGAQLRRPSRFGEVEDGSELSVCVEVCASRFTAISDVMRTAGSLGGPTNRVLARIPQSNGRIPASTWGGIAPRKRRRALVRDPPGTEICPYLPGDAPGGQQFYEAVRPRGSRGMMEGEHRGG